MLGCHDFCGHYDWTFQYLRRRFGNDALHEMWATAIGDDSQAHYTKAGRERGLRGLHDVWVKTGEDEKCDWTYTLDEEKNVLRCDMRQCPSKGFLLGNDLQADEDYCDHCAGWVEPMLEKLGMEIASHEHNHAGQCWWEIRVKGKPYQSLNLDIDIRKDPRWKHGFLETWKNGKQQPLLPQASNSVDSCEVLRDWFKDVDRLLVLGRGPSAADERAHELVRKATASPRSHVIVIDPTYATRDVFEGEPLAVLIGDRSQSLEKVAKRFLATPPAQRPLLMHMYLPGVPMLDFVSHGLPRPVPILPLLIREKLYTHEPHAPYPTTGVFAVLLAAALGKNVDVAGIDLYRHHSGKMYARAQETQRWPAWHSEACDVQSLLIAREKIGAAIHYSSALDALLAASLR